jgi:hypothetical protein
LVALASKIDQPLIPPLKQVVIFSRMLGHICELEAQRLPKEPFERLPCRISNDEELDKGIEENGIDFLGCYEHGSNEIAVILNICRIMKFSARHGFHPEDAVKIVLIDELAHLVTNFGTASGVYWEKFCDARSEKKEDLAQEAAHLLLRVGGYGHLVNVFDSLSYLCPAKYNTWRKTWKGQLKSKKNLDAVLKEFRHEVHKFRLSPDVKDLECEPIDE